MAAIHALILQADIHRPIALLAGGGIKTFLDGWQS
jgi:hypothetical protein